MKNIFITVLAMLMAAGGVASNSTDITFGYAEADITPEIGTRLGIWRRPATQAIHDKLYVRCLAVKDSDARTVLFVSVDVIFVFWNVTDALLKHCEQKYNINASDILINGSHTHNSPRTHRGKYGNFVTAKMLDCVDRAMAGCRTKGYLVYARTESELGVSRRHPYTMNGRQLMAFRPYVAGKTDKTVNVLAFYNSDDQLNSVVWVYPCHSTFFTQYIDKKVQVSSDFSAAVRKVMKQKLGENVNIIFLQGFGGDVKPRSISDKRDKNHLPIFTSDPGSAAMRKFSEQYGAPLAEHIKSMKHLKVPVKFKSAAKTFTLTYHTSGPVWRNRLKTRAQLEELIKSPSDSDAKRKAYENQLKKGWYIGGKPTATFYCQKIAINDDMQILGLSGEPTSGVAQLLYHAFSRKENILVGYIRAGTYICNEAQQKEGGSPEVKGFGDKLDETIVSSFESLKPE